MNVTDPLLQLERISAIQSELRETLLTDDAAGLEDLLTEKRSRMDSVLALAATGSLDSASIRAKLVAILAEDVDIQSLITKQVMVLATTIRKATEAQRMARGYVTAPALAEAQSPALGITA